MELRRHGRCGRGDDFSRTERSKAELAPDQWSRRNLAHPARIRYERGRVQDFERETGRPIWADFGSDWRSRPATTPRASSPPLVLVLLFRPPPTQRRFQRPMQHSALQQTWDQQVSICYLLGLDWVIPWQIPGVARSGEGRSRTPQSGQGRRSRSLLRQGRRSPNPPDRRRCPRIDDYASN